MSARDDILGAIRANKPAMNAPAPAVPNYDESYPQDADGLAARRACPPGKVRRGGDPGRGQAAREDRRDHAAEAAG